MNLNIKTISIGVGLLLTLSGVAYKGVLKVQQVDTNTHDIRRVEANVKLDKLCQLHRQALSDYYYWDAECKKSNLPQPCQNAAEALRRVKSLEKQLEDIEKETGEVCR